MLLNGNPLLSQTEQQKIKLRAITEQYFKTNTEEKYISQIIENLKNNIGFVSDTLISKTDTSLFYIRGYSTSFNPFSISVNKIEIQFRENKVQIKGEEKPKDTVLILQIIGITDSTDENKSRVSEELKRISKEFISVFPYFYHEKSTKKAKVPYEFFSFKIFSTPYPSMTIGYGNYYKNQKIHCISLQLYYKLRIE